MRFVALSGERLYDGKSFLQGQSRTGMLKAQPSLRESVLVMALLMAFSLVALHTGGAAAVPPDRPYAPADTALSSAVTFHTFDIEEVFSNFDGSIQFIELREAAGLDGQFQFAGNQLISSRSVFTYPTDLPDPATANRSVLVATAAFAALPGAVTPDYIIPERFFEVTGDTISILEAQTNVLVDTFVFGGPPQNPCPCDGDVDNNGVVNILDGVCILACRGGDCSCCLSSCDVNCDGVVDAGDAADDIISADSTWLCLFKGGSTEVCCAEPITGACCIGEVCEELEQDACVGASGQYLGDDTVCTVDTCAPPPPPTGACCTGEVCDVREHDACVGAGGEYLGDGTVCAAETCAPPPTGACCVTLDCLIMTGAKCDGAGGAYQGDDTSCTEATCALPPCTCDPDVDGSGGLLQIQDWICIRECILGDCSCCVNSCDLNCDGLVNDLDAGPDPTVEDGSVFRCFWVGNSADICCAEPPPPSTGASRLGPAAVSSLIPPDGACCNVGDGQCQDGVQEVDCTGIGLVWTASTVCSVLSCVATFLPTDGALSLKSDGTTGINSPTNFAGEFGSVNAAPPLVPTMSRRSLVVMMLLLITAAVAITRTRRRGISPST